MLSTGKCTSCSSSAFSKQRSQTDKAGFALGGYLPPELEVDLMLFSVSVNMSQRLLNFELMSQAHSSHFQSLWPSQWLSLSFSSKSSVNSRSKSVPCPRCFVFIIVVTKLGKLYILISSVPTWSQACFAAIIKAIEPTLSGDDVFLWFDVLILRVLMPNPFIYKNCGPEKSYFLHLKFIHNESRILIGDLSLLSV